MPTYQIRIVHHQEQTVEITATDAQQAQKQALASAVWQNIPAQIQCMGMRIVDPADLTNKS